MYRPTFALDAIGRNEPGSIQLAVEVMGDACEFLTKVNRRYLRRFPPCACRAGLLRDPKTGVWSCPRCRQRMFPLLYTAGIVYDRMTPNGPACGDDDWADLPTVYRLNRGDCEDIACIRVAELQEYGIAPGAVPYVYLDLDNPNARAKHMYHIQVRWPEGLRAYPATVRRIDGMLIEDPSEVLGMKGAA